MISWNLLVCQNVLQTHINPDKLSLKRGHWESVKLSHLSVEGESGMWTTWSHSSDATLTCGHLVDQDIFYFNSYIICSSENQATEYPQLFRFYNRKTASKNWEKGI